MGKEVVWLSVVAVGLVALVVSTAEALECFHCINCGDAVGVPYDCESKNDVCTKIIVAGTINKQCGKKALCSLGVVEEVGVTAWNAVKNFISNVGDDKIDVPDDAEAKFLKCCDTDGCNTASSKMTNPLLLFLLPLAAYLLRW